MARSRRRAPYRGYSRGGEANAFGLIAIVFVLCAGVCFAALAVLITVVRVAFWGARSLWAIHKSGPRPAFPALNFIEAWGIRTPAISAPLPPPRPASSPGLPPRNNGRSFEQQCAIHFASQGFHVTETPVSGDHGADLIIRTRSRTVAIQCKDYKGRAGTRAVQEVYAARGFYGTDEARVICPGGFTKNAELMARKLDVRLSMSP